MKNNRRGMALVIVLIAMLCFSIVMFGIAQQQQHETRWTAITIEQQRAFVLADAGLSRALARHIAKKYKERWYGKTPNGDLLPALDHSGRFNEESQGVDEGGGGAPTGDKKLDAHGTYEVMVEDRHVGEFSGGGALADTKLMFTDVYSKGTVEGPRGKPVNVLLFGRIVIAPEVPYFDPPATPPAPPPGQPPADPPFQFSTEEMLKRLIRYKVYFAPEIADRDLQQPNSDTVAVREIVHNEIALYHQNFLKNRNTFKDFRDPAKVPPNWQEGSAGQAQWTKAQIDGLFSGIATETTVPSPGSNNPNDPANGQFHNAWTDELLRRYRVSDLVLANTGFKYLIPATDLTGRPTLPTAAQSKILDNILRVFYPPRTLTPINPRFLESPPPNPPVTDGNELLDLQKGSSDQSVQASLEQPRETFNTRVSSWERLEAGATILLSHWDPFPSPSVKPTDASTIARKFDGADFFKNRFETETLTPAIITEMQQENKRVNDLGATPQISDAAYIGGRGTRDQPFPLVLRYDPPTGGAAPPSPTQIAVDELIKFYAKYIESAAAFTGGSGEITPVPPLPTTPPTESPSPPPPDPNGGGNGGGGGGTNPPPPPRPGGYGIGGGGAGI
jgi:hypothetical protein